jgi:NTE family protein
MSRRRVAIACQGGGSQCAFVAGALKALFAARVQDRYQIVGLSGTSGGAFTAALAWAGMLKQSRGDKTPIEDEIVACWNDLTAQTRREIAFDRHCIELVRLVESGFLPSFATSPSSPQFRIFSWLASRYIARPAFTDLRALLVRHLDFERLAPLAGPDLPTLLVGAVDVIEGTFKTFSSWRGDVSIDALLASAAIPTLFPAARVDGKAYWDGIFSSNPPVLAFLQRTYIGPGALPEEIWVVQVNRSRNERVPKRASDIFDRRNHLAGNLSLQHELQTIELVNFLIGEGAVSEEFRTRFGLDMTEAIKVRFIRMSRDLEDSLDYPSKLSRQPALIARLLADGEAQARLFLAEVH